MVGQQLGEIISHLAEQLTAREPKLVSRSAYPLLTSATLLSCSISHPHHPSHSSDIQIVAFKPSIREHGLNFCTRFSLISAHLGVACGSSKQLRGRPIKGKDEILQIGAGPPAHSLRHIGRFLAY